MINQGVRQELGSTRMASGLNKQTKPKNEGKAMNNKFDELAKGLAQSVTRRQAFKKFGVGLASMALACFGLANTAEARNCGPSNPCCCVGCNTQFPESSPNYAYCEQSCRCLGPIKCRKHCV